MHRPPPSGLNPRAKRARVIATDIPSTSSAPTSGSSDARPEVTLESLSQAESRLLANFIGIKVPDRANVSITEKPLSFEPRLYPSSSVLGNNVSRTAMELYMHNMLPIDKMEMLNRAHPAVEKHAAVLLSRLALCVQQLALTCSEYKSEEAEIEKEFLKYQEQAKAEKRGVRAECEDIRKQLEAEKLQASKLQGEVNEWKAKFDKATRQLEQERARKAEERRRAIDQAMKDDVGEYLLSSDFTADIERREMEARQRAVRDFLKSEELDLLILQNAMNDRDDGFYKAVDYMKQLGAQLPISFEEFETDYRAQDLLRPSVAIDVPPDVSFPEFRPIIEAVEEENPPFG